MVGGGSRGPQGCLRECEENFVRKWPLGEPSGRGAAFAKGLGPGGASREVWQVQRD